MKVRQFRQMMEEDPSDEDIPTGYEMFKELEDADDHWSRNKKRGD